MRERVRLVSVVVSVLLMLEITALGELLPLLNMDALVLVTGTGVLLIYLRLSLIVNHFFNCFFLNDFEEVHKVNSLITLIY